MAARIGQGSARDAAATELAEKQAELRFKSKQPPAAESHPKTLHL